MKIIELLPTQPRAAALRALPRGAFDAGTAADGDATRELVLTTLRPTAGLPFLAQYLAQEFVAADGVHARWRERDDAYRLAGTQPAAARLSFDI